MKPKHKRYANLSFTATNNHNNGDGFIGDDRPWQGCITKQIV